MLTDKGKAPIKTNGLNGVQAPDISLPELDDLSGDGGGDESRRQEEGDKEALLAAITEATPEQIEEVFSDLLDRPWPKGNLDGWPAFRDIRIRATKSEKLTQAARLLEEAGEDEMALTLLGRTEFTPLELEVAALLRAFGELETN